jgi:hypothetical protein
MEVKIVTNWEKTKIFIARAAIAILMMFLLGATGTNGIGRYQIAAAGVHTAGSSCFALLDTATGEVRPVKLQF